MRGICRVLNGLGAFCAHYKAETGTAGPHKCWLERTKKTALRPVTSRSRTLPTRYSYTSMHFSETPLCLLQTSRAWFNTKALPVIDTKRQPNSLWTESGVRGFHSGVNVSILIYLLEKDRPVCMGTTSFQKAVDALYSSFEAIATTLQLHKRFYLRIIQFLIIFFFFFLIVMACKETQYILRNWQYSNGCSAEFQPI